MVALPVIQLDRSRNVGVALGGDGVRPELVTAMAALAGAVLAVALLAVGTRRLARVPVWHKVAQVVMTAGLLGLLALRAATIAAFCVGIGVVVFGVPLAIVDAWSYRLPSWLVVPLVITTAVTITAVTLVTHDLEMFLRAVRGFVLAAGLYGGLALAHPGHVGAGDVKLAAPLGLVLGWYGWSTLVAGVLFWTTASAVAAVVKAIVSKNARVALPMGPFMIGGTLIAMSCVGGSDVLFGGAG